MNDTQRLALVGAAVRSGYAVMEKSAAASDQQAEILGAGWPTEGEQITKKARLSRIIATGMIVEEGEAALAEAYAAQVGAQA